MRVSLTMVAVFLAIGGSAFAEPAKRDAAKPAVQQPAEVVLASASPPNGSASVGTQQGSTPSKRPAPRVTTCRCGDPQADTLSQEQ